MWSLTEFAQTYSAMHASFASGVVVVTRLTVPPHCASDTSPDSECQILVTLKYCLWRSPRISDMDKQLQKYECAPSQAGKEWAQKFWEDKAIICQYWRFTYLTCKRESKNPSSLKCIIYRTWCFEMRKLSIKVISGFWEGNKRKIGNPKTSL